VDGGPGPAYLLQSRRISFRTKKGMAEALRELELALGTSGTGTDCTRKPAPASEAQWAPATRWMSRMVLWYRVTGRTKLLQWSSACRNEAIKREGVDLIFPLPQIAQSVLDHTR
jgi:hypothetical protein